MAIDKAVDSGKLDAALEATADAIRIKTGGSADITFDMSTETGFADAIESIPTGGGGDFDAILNGTLREINSNVTSVRSHACNSLSSLVSVSLPNATSLGDNSFTSCANLETFSAPNVSNNFVRNIVTGSKVTGLVFPNVKTLGAGFPSNSLMTTFDFGNSALTGGSISGNCFNNCTVLATLIIRTNTVTTLAATSAFSGTKISSDPAARIYVPESLIESYQSSANWSALYAANSDIFEAIEGSEYEE